MAQEIINIEQYGDALRSTGYKNIESAVSEIVDNSIEAAAPDVFVIVTDSIPAYSGRRHVTEIAFLDNGIGMDETLLQSCLQIGYGTRTARHGMGRFGVGLPQASLHVCPLVEVYSWQDGIKNCKKTFLDINKIKSGEQKSFDTPEVTPIPQRYQMYLSCHEFGKDFDFTDTGTLVIWKDCDNVSPKTVKPLFDRLEFALGQKFRHLIRKSTQSIYLLHSENEQYNRPIMPNDPLFLMTPNLVLGDTTRPGTIKLRDNDTFTEPLFEPFTNELYPDGTMKVPVSYIDRETKAEKASFVTLKFSVVRREFYDKTAISGSPGGTKMGEHVKKLEGISVIRANREIDFGSFDFYSNLNEPEHRWWGCEISFTPELDEAFGVSNNKQHVELIRLDDEEYEEDDVKPIWIQLRKHVRDTISEMYKRNKNIRQGSRTAQDEVSPAEQIINQAEEGSTVTTYSEHVRDQTPEDDVREYIINALSEQLGQEPGEEVVVAHLTNKINFIYRGNGRSHFFDYDMGLGVCNCIINTDHIFYKHFLRHLEDDTDAKTAFELFLGSLVRTIDEASERERDAFDELITIWNEKLRKYINKQINSES